jgi:glycosyltransferase involved in cell wall biosynthesis
VSKNIFIVSAKYAAGLFKEFSLFGKNLEQLGYQVNYILARKYEKIVLEYTKDQPSFSKYYYVFDSANSREIIRDTISYQLTIRRTIDSLFLEISPDFFLIYNPHPLNYLLLQQAKKANILCQTAIYLHEPHKPDKYLYGIIGSLYFKIVDICQELCLKYTDIMILPSPYAVELFKIRFPKFSGRSYLAPILISNRPVEPQLRKFLTIAGVINKGKGLDTFCELIEYAVERNLNYQFRIATTSNIESYVNSLSESAKKITLIENPRSITDKEMFQIHAESKAFFLLHTTGTQSGAMIVAFMHGTPLIARDIPAFSQFIQDKKNSCLIDKQCTSANVISQIEYVEKNLEQLSIGSRKSFEDIFSEDNWSSNYSWLVDLLASDSRETTN